MLATILLKLIHYRFCRFLAIFNVFSEYLLAFIFFISGRCKVVILLTFRTLSINAAGDVGVSGSRKPLDFSGVETQFIVKLLFIPMGFLILVIHWTRFYTAKI